MTADYSLHRIADLLAPSVGDVAAREAIESAARVLGFSASSSLSQDDALSVLERVAETPGILGVTARFAKTRLLLG